MRLFRPLVFIVIVLAACGQPQAETPPAVPVVTTSIPSTSSAMPLPNTTAPASVKPAAKRPQPDKPRRVERLEAAPAKTITDTVVVYTLAPTFTADGNRYVPENITTEPMESNTADTEEDCGCN